MKINEMELAKIEAMLEAYKKKHGTIAKNETSVVNCTSICASTCTATCYIYCDGSRCYCWKTWKGG